MDAIINVFNFIYSIFDNIISGIFGCIDLIDSIMVFILSITKIIPSPLYQCLMSFLTLYLAIFTYKIYRKG